jgi:hypothetical protein
VHRTIELNYVCASTGKRRYGHPALNGVLPEPWLPLKKGQTLVNSNRAGGPRRSKDDSQAVVLTLRKRYSMSPRHRRSSAPAGAGTHDLLGLGDTAVGSGVDGEAETNPWQDTRSRRMSRSQTAPAAQQQTLHHRLSFDPASGVIMLPENDDWLAEDSDSSDELLDLGPDNGGVSESSNAGDATTIAGDGASVTGAGDDSVASPSKRRYGTYYHHPERRRQPIPGAFPR